MMAWKMSIAAACLLHIMFYIFLMFAGFPTFLNQFGASCCLAIMSGHSSDIYIWKQDDKEGRDRGDNHDAGAPLVPATCKDMCRANMG